MRARSKRCPFARRGSGDVRCIILPTSGYGVHALLIGRRW